MADVLHLPNRGERVWASFAGRLAEIATENGYDPEDVEIVLGELKPLFLEAYGHPPVRADSDIIAEMNQWVANFTLRLLVIATKARLELREALKR